MSSMADVIVPKSDQWNADDFLAGPRTFTIRNVDIRRGQEQPVNIYLEGTDKAYRPCKSMSRVLVQAWGPDAKLYAGRSLTLYLDPSVKWAGIAVGGIRISHLSHIDGQIQMPLTATRGSKKLFVVEPLRLPAAPITGNEELERLKKQAMEQARFGTTTLKDHWDRLTKQQRQMLGPFRDEFKKLAAEADDAVQVGPTEPDERQPGDDDEPY